ncbi:MAG: hypothetical protein ACUVQ3_07190 [bacterium]
MYLHLYIVDNIAKRSFKQADKPIFNHPVFRVYPKTKNELLEEGIEYPREIKLSLNQNPEQLPYSGNKCGKIPESTKDIF